MTLVTTEWLNNNLGKVKIIDCSWHMPATNRNSYKEFKKKHIEGAIFFDLDQNSNQNKYLAHNHFLPDKTQWEKIISSMGISNNDKIVIYDNSDLISSCRCWFSFIYFGHSSNLVSILNGGLKKWLLEKRKVTKQKTKIKKSNYYAKEKKYLAINKSQIDKNINNEEFILVDARSKNRFSGIEREPRPNVKSGSISGSKNLPFLECIDSRNNAFLSEKNLKEKFRSIGISNNENCVFTCGSSVTAAVLGVAYSLINNQYMPKIYIGSWNEYGKNKT